MTAAARKAVLDEIVDRELAELHRIASARAAAEAAVEAEAERKARARREGDEARDAWLGTVQTIQEAARVLASAWQEGKRHRATAFRAYGIAGVVMPQLTDTSSAQRVSKFLAELLATMGGSPAHFGQLKLRATGKKWPNDDWAAAERAHLHAMNHSTEDTDHDRAA